MLGSPAIRSAESRWATWPARHHRSALRASRLLGHQRVERAYRRNEHHQGGDQDETVGQDHWRSAQRQSQAGEVAVADFAPVWPRSHCADVCVAARAVAAYLWGRAQGHGSDRADDTAQCIRAERMPTQVAARHAATRPHPSARASHLTLGTMRVFCSRETGDRPSVRAGHSWKNCLSCLLSALGMASNCRN